MESFSKIILQQRKGYREVFIYYSRHGAKFRESTKVKVFDQGIVDLERVLGDPLSRDRIQQLHHRVESLIRYYLIQYEEKPPAQWLRMEFKKLKIKEHLKLPSVNSSEIERSGTTTLQAQEIRTGGITRIYSFIGPISLQ